MTSPICASPVTQPWPAPSIAEAPQWYAIHTRSQHEKSVVSQLEKGGVTTFLPLTDRKSTRLNSSHTVISYAVFCLKKKKKNNEPYHPNEEPTTINKRSKQ